MTKQRYLYPMLGMTVLTACSEDVRTDKDLPSSPGVIVAAPPVQQPASCSFRDAKSFARDYFLVPATKNAATSALSAAEGFAVGSQARADALWDVLELVASVGGVFPTSATDNDGSELTGAKLVNEVVECGQALSSGEVAGDKYLKVTDARGFQDVIMSALTDNQGEFAIRGDGPGTLLVGSEAKTGIVSNVAIAPNVGKDDWADQVGPVAVFLGQVSGVNFGGINANLVTTYRIGLIYIGTLNPTPPPTYVAPPDFSDDDYFAVEFCNVAGTLQQRVGRSRGENSQLNTVLQQSDIKNFCQDDNTITQSPFVSRSIFAQAIDRVAGFFLPTTLEALVVAPPPWSGSTGGLESDFSVVEVDTLNVTGTQEIPGGVRGQTVPFTIGAFTGPSAPFTQIPLENVEIRITVAGNQGSPVFLSSGNSGTTCAVDGQSCTAYTNESGLANFGVIFDKAGGYTLNITAVYSGFPNLVFLSNLFNISGS